MGGNVSTQKQYQGIGTISVASLGETLATIATIDTKGLGRIFMEIQVTTQALDQFTIAARPASGGTYNVLYSIGADYTSPSAPLVLASGDLTAIAAAATGWFILDVDSFESVRIQAAAAAASAVIASYVGGN